MIDAVRLEVVDDGADFNFAPCRGNSSRNPPWAEFPVATTSSWCRRHRFSAIKADRDRKKLAIAHPTNRNTNLSRAIPVIGEFGSTSFQAEAPRTELLRPTGAARLVSPHPGDDRRRPTKAGGAILRRPTEGFIDAADRRNVSAASPYGPRSVRAENPSPPIERFRSQEVAQRRFSESVG
jgi:hypothetical protein